MNPIHYNVDDHRLSVDHFLGLVQRVWPGQYDPDATELALQRTINITAWSGETLVGCVRILTDGYFFATIPEILVDPACQGMGVGARLMELAWEASPTSLFFGAQPGKEGFYERLGYTPGMQSYVKKKPRISRQSRDRL